MKFKLSKEFIMLNQLLKAAGIAQTGGHAKMMIDDGEVIVNGKVEFRVRNKLRLGDKIQIGEEVIIITD